VLIAWKTTYVGNLQVGRVRKVRNGELQHPSCPFSFNHILTIITEFVF